MLIQILLITLAAVAQAKRTPATPPITNFSIKVDFDQTSYTLEFKSGVLSYEDSEESLLIKAQDCNRSVIDRIAGGYQRLVETVPAERARTQYDVAVRLRKKTLFVARGTSFGIWLRNLPGHILMDEAEARILCKQ